MEIGRTSSMFSFALAIVVAAWSPRDQRGPAPSESGRTLTRCEVARELALKHVPEEQIGDWLCIAEHGSGYNSSAANLRFKRFGGSGYYGLFQIIDRYACARYGSICGLAACELLLDDELDDDIECMLKVHAAYTRELGDGFAAWPIHKSACRGLGTAPPAPFADCLDDEVVRVQAYFKRKRAKARKAANLVALPSPSGKVYERCELAVELRDRHRMPEEQIASWVCIAYHESRFNTSAEGRLNADGSGDHGLFQISDIYWCSTDASRPGKACGVTCDAMRDSDIADDVRCIRTIHDEHRRLSGNGFNAWTVYRPHCEGRADSFVHNCFEERYPTTASKPRPGIVAPSVPLTSPAGKAQRPVAPTGKVYDRCELANDLLHKFGFAREQVATWVCIAYHESAFNTSAEGRLNADGSGDHGLFQISDIYWCSPPGTGWACGVSCEALKDSDIADDMRCVRTIYDEHQRLSGDGFNAWSVYKPYCQGRAADDFTRGCFGDASSPSTPMPRPAITAPPALPAPGRTGAPVGKVFERCELAQQLHLRHGLSLDETANWVCIAKYQSNFNSSAVGQGPAGVQYHGLFQLSDEFWCSPPGRGLVCGLACEQLRDADLGDDLACMAHIYEEHQRISGVGYNAWAVYQPYCRGKSATLLDGCFEEGENALVPSPPTTRRPPPPPKNHPRGKVYGRCELAQELLFRHGLPFDQIATWVCIAHRESDYNVSAVGRLNADGSGDHGLFQISDIYWCSPPGTGWVCGLPCSDLEDNDLADDVECMRTIHEEHTRLSGDGFNAWAVYRPYCKGRSEPYIKGCFDESPTTTTTTTTTTSTAIATTLASPVTVRPTARPLLTTTTSRRSTSRSRANSTTFRTWLRTTAPRPSTVTTDRPATTTISPRSSSGRVTYGHTQPVRFSALNFPSSRPTTTTTTTTTRSSSGKVSYGPTQPPRTSPPSVPSRGATTPAAVTKSTTSLYEFYLNHFGRRPAVTTAMPVYTFKPFASRLRPAATAAPAAPPTAFTYSPRAMTTLPPPMSATTLVLDDLSSPTTARLSDFNRWFQHG